jgi:hypothetical protein
MAKREALEARIAVGNIGFFLEEFSFSRAEFTPTGRSEIELAARDRSFMNRGDALARLLLGFVAVGLLNGCSNGCVDRGQVLWISTNQRQHVVTATSSAPCTLLCATEGTFPSCDADSKYYRVVADAEGSCHLRVDFDDGSPSYEADTAFQKCCDTSYCTADRKELRVPE